MHYKIKKGTNEVISVVDEKDVVDLAVEAVCYAIEEVKKGMNERLQKSNQSPKDMKVDIIKDIIGIAIQEAIGELDDRLVTIEKMRQQSNQLEYSNIAKTSTLNVFQGLNL